MIMTIHFYKYQGTGNDFVMIDNRVSLWQLSEAQIQAICERRTGIGADGLILLENDPEADFRMIYYNADGKESSMCGNGGRCITAFAHHLGIIDAKTTFRAIDGMHEALIQEGIISLHMKDVSTIDHQKNYTILDTGSPHLVIFIDDVASVNVFEEGRKYRQLPAFMPKGINVNFVQQQGEKLMVRTYERGVEAETLSCGTGVTAAAIAHSKLDLGTFKIPIQTPGGALEVSFRKTSARTADNIWLIGPADFVFEGNIKLG